MLSEFFWKSLDWYELLLFELLFHFNKFDCLIKERGFRVLHKKSIIINEQHFNCLFWEFSSFELFESKVTQTYHEKPVKKGRLLGVFISLFINLYRGFVSPQISDHFKVLLWRCQSVGEEFKKVFTKVGYFIKIFILIIIKKLLKKSGWFLIL